MRKYLFFGLLITFVAIVEAQTIHVTGSVTDGRSSMPMPWVNVALMRTADTVFVRGATTGEDGSFDIRDVDTGTYLLRASFMGYNTLFQRVDVATLDSSLNLGNLQLQPGQVLNKVVVSAQKPLFAMDGEKNLYNTSEDPSVQTGTASDALQNAPGVEVDAEGNITLRGVSSVEIWINDHPSHMNEEALKQYIKQMPANAIERIEVITNPSARYSSKGGVINIVTSQTVKRNELLCVGLNGSTLPQLSPWISYVWANEKVDFNLYLNGHYGKYETATDDTSYLYNDDHVLSRFQQKNQTVSSSGFGDYIGLNLNWKIDTMTNLTTWMGAFPHKSKNSSDTKFIYNEYLPTPSGDLGYKQNHEGDDFGWGGYLGAWLEHRFNNEGHKISLSINGNTWDGHGTTSNVRQYNNSSLGVLDRYDSTSLVSPSISMELNYSRPLKNDFEIETGVGVALSGEHQYSKTDSLNHATGSYTEELMLSHEGKERGTGLSAYVTGQKRWGNFTAKLGLRAEQSWKHSEKNYLFNATTTDVDTSFFGLVPSVHFSYRTENMHNFSLSYTLRNSTPAPSQLNPFIAYSDYSYSTGNPNLSKSFTHNLEAAWNKYFMKFGSVGLSSYFRANTDEIQSLTDVAFSNYHNAWVNYSYPVNVGRSHTEGLEANITFRPSAMFNLRFNANVYNYYYETQYRDETISDSKVSYSLRLNLWTKVWNKLEIFANAHYRSKSLGLYTLTNVDKGIDLGCSADFFARKMSVFMNMHNILGWMEFGESSTNPYYTSTGSNRFNGQAISAGITFRFGKMELESKARQGGSETTGRGVN